MMSIKDLFEVADEFTVMRSTKNMNVNWIEGVESQHNKANYYDVNVSEGGKVVFATYMGSTPCRNSIILAARLIDGYRFVAGSMEEWSITNSIEAELLPGKHVLFIKTEWPTPRPSNFNLLYCYSLPLSISKAPKPLNFLSLLFT